MKPIRYAAWALALFLLLLHVPVVLTHTALVISLAVVPTTAVGYWLAVLLSTMLLAAGFKNGRIVGSNAYLLLISVLILMLGSGMGWLVADAPSLADDYSGQDVACPANGSFAHLSVFNAGGNGEPVMRGPDEPQAVDAVWALIRERRNAIDALERFEYICDLPEDAVFNVEIPMLNFAALRETADIYGRYFLAGAADGQGGEPVAAFCRFHRVVRKGLDNASLLVHKLIFANLVEKSIDATWCAMQSGNMGRQTLIALQDAFLSLQLDEISLARPLISKYLVMKNTLRGLTPDHLMDSVTLPMPGFIDPEPSRNPLLSRVVYYLGFKPNRSLAQLKNDYDRLIEAHRHHPVDSTKPHAQMTAYAAKPPVRNMVGWMLNSMATPDFSQYSDRLAAIKIKSDLLAHALSGRFGRRPAMADYYTGGTLSVREGARSLRHPGKDGVFDTPDDIVLGRGR